MCRHSEGKWCGDIIVECCLANPNSGVRHCHAPTICETHRGTLLLVWYAYPDVETREGTLVLSRKPRGDGCWQDSRRILTEMNGTMANPVLFEDSGGILWLLFVTLRGHYWDSAVVMASRSEDEGQTWARPEVVLGDTGMMVRHPPLMRGDRTMILPAYDEGSNQTVLFALDPGGTVWRECHRFAAPNTIQACLVGESIRNWSLIFRPVGEQRTCLRALSSDEGRTWSPIIQTSLPNPLSGVAAFYAHGALCVVHNHTAEHRRFPLSLCYSQDRGVTWSEPRHIDSAQHEVSYPSFIVDGAGSVHGAYTYDRRRIKYVSFDKSWWQE